ncbi:MAG: Gfo/Idh/MocA family oxidoreductase [Planctomycetota bacterium]|nr:Gfo/Idh/MocA family oxidoreductase [Planctomycetota bacterium]
MSSSNDPGSSHAESSKLGVGIIGYGYWGPNLARNFSETPGAELVAVSDLREERLALVRARYPAARVTTNYAELLENPAVHAVAVATPVSSHYKVVEAALRTGKHVLVEKPLTDSADLGRRLVDEAARRKLVLMVDHTFIYTSAVRKIKELVDNGRLGKIYYYDSVRINLGLFQHDVNVLWDLAVHDLSILDHVLAARPNAVSATGISHVEGRPENTAYLTLYFPDRLIAHLHVNWLAPVKVRRTLIGGSQEMIVYDDIEPSEKVKVYDRGITVASSPDSVYRLLVSYRSGDMWAPLLDNSEALRTEAAHFVRCVQHGEKPLSDGESGLRVVRILEAATRSMKERGQPVAL